MSGLTLVSPSSFPPSTPIVQIKHIEFICLVNLFFSWLLASAMGNRSTLTYLEAPEKILLSKTVSTGNTKRWYEWWRISSLLMLTVSQLKAFLVAESNSLPIISYKISFSRCQTTLERPLSKVQRPKNWGK